MNFHVVVLAGDGIGPEIVAQSQRVLEAVGKKFGHTFEYENQDAGGIADIEALVAQSQKRSAVYDVITNPVNVTVEVV